MNGESQLDLFGSIAVGSCGPTSSRKSSGACFSELKRRVLEYLTDADGEWVGLRETTRPGNFNNLTSTKRPALAEACEQLVKDGLIESKPKTGGKAFYYRLALRSQKASNLVVIARPPDQPELPDLLRRSYKEFDMLDEWIAFCDRFPGLKWFVIDGVVLFPIPLVEQLKAENPGILSEDVYNKDYSAHFAPKSIRVPVRCCLKGNTLEIPSWVKSITEREGTREAYQLKGYEDDPNAVGFVFEGGPHPRHYGKASYEAHQQIGAALGKIGIFHAVTFPVLYAYLVQGRSNISRRAQRLGSTAITQAVKQGIQARQESTPATELAAAGAHDPGFNQVIQSLQDMERNIESQFSEMNQRVGQLESLLEQTYHHAESAAVNAEKVATTKQGNGFPDSVKREACRLYLKSRHGDGRDRLNDILIVDADGNKTDQCDFHHFNRVKHDSIVENCLPVSRETHRKIHSKNGLTHEEEADLARCLAAMIEILKLEQQQADRVRPVQASLSLSV